MGDSIFGPSVRSAMGLGSSAAATRRFRDWLAKVFERMENARRLMVSVLCFPCFFLPFPRMFGGSGPAQFMRCCVHEL